MKGGLELEPGASRPEGLIEYCSPCGWSLALAHAKSGDAAQIAGYLGKSESFDEAMVRFASAYSEQTQRDYDALAAAARSGSIPVARLPA